MRKRRDMISAGTVERGERKRTAAEASKCDLTMSKPRADPSLGISSGDVLILPERHPACRRREARPGSCMERENLAGDAKGKAQAAPTARPKVPMRRRGADCPVVVMKRGNARGAKGAGHRGSVGRRQPSRGNTSRMMREYQVRICERLGVKFPGPTRRSGSDRFLAHEM